MDSSIITLITIGYALGIAICGVLAYLGIKGTNEAIELADALGIKIDEAELVRTNSTGLTIYNPTNLADRIKGMKNKSMTREQKILLRKQYEQSMN